MQSIAERDRRKRLVRVTWALLVLAILFELWLLRTPTSTQPGLAPTFALAILPNLIAGLIGVVAIDWVARWLLQDSDRQRYLTALALVRDALRQARTRHSIQPTDVREVMKKVVAAVSDLYFSKKRPRAQEEDIETKAHAVECDICLLPCKMEGGQCEFCGDLYQGWFSAQNRAHPDTGSAELGNGS